MGRNRERRERKGDEKGGLKTWGGKGKGWRKGVKYRRESAN